MIKIMISINKQDVAKTVLIIWFIAATGYVAYDQYLGFKVRGMQAAYQQGITDAAKQIFDKSQAGQCKEAVTITLGENKLEFIDVKCLQSAPTTDAQPQAEASKVTAPKNK